MVDRLRGRDLRQARIEAGLKQAELAAALNIHTAIISGIETETSGEYPSPEFVARYLMALTDNAANQAVA